MMGNNMIMMERLNFLDFLKVTSIQDLIKIT